MKIKFTEQHKNYKVYVCYIDNLIVEVAYERNDPRFLMIYENEIAMCAEYKTGYNHDIFTYGSPAQKLWYALDEFLLSVGITVLSVE